jgi:group I intron endonuclease
MIAIYKIVNIINNKIYVGSTVHYNIRIREHKYALKNNFHRNKILQKAWNKYGESNFKFEILELLNENSTLEDILVTEQKYLNSLKSYDRKIGYNINKTAGSNLGFKMPESAKQKLRHVNTGKKHSLETRKKISEIQKGKKRKFISKLKTSLKCRGENNKSAKINWEQVREIRKKRQEGKTLKQIALLFNLSETNISSICNHKTWKEGEYYVDTIESS